MPGKKIAAESRADTDSVAASLTSGYFLRIDTAMRRINFDFDTLDITIERHAADAALSAASPEETVRIRAVGGKIADCRRQTRNAIADITDLTPWPTATPPPHREPNTQPPPP